MKTKHDAVEKRVEAILSRMTLAEMIGQMCQVHGACEENQDLARRGLVGSVLNVLGPEAERMQTIAVRESRLGIPLLIGRDVIHGFRTIFPIPLGLAASFDPDLVRRCSRIAAREATALGVSWTFAPMVDIARDPRWGRIAEGFGEDPALASALGAAAVEGFQGSNMAAPDRLLACAKHYVGYGAAEAGRDYNTTFIPEGLLRDVYLEPFRACVSAGAASLMSAFNDLNGIPATGNRLTLRRVLKGEWGFDGLVVSDWGSVVEMIAHGYCADAREAALKALAAGVDMEMVSRCYADHIEDLLRRKRVPAAWVRDAVRRILRVKIRAGLFERPLKSNGRAGVLASPAHREAAREAARRCCVLLKNDGALPLAKTLARVAVIGPMADNAAAQNGCWCMDQRPEADSVTPLAALRAALGEDRVAFAPGVPDCRSADASLVPAAVAAAQDAEAALLFLGEDAGLSGEAHCRAFIELPGAQQQLVDAVAATGRPCVAVVFTGRPLALAALADKVRAILLAWHPGTLAGPALADLLFGDAAPSGKLPATFPRALGQVPIYHAQRNTGRPPRDDVAGPPLGTPLDPKDFTSKHMDVDHRPLYPFGHGLSYTTFEYADLRVAPAVIGRAGALTASVRVANTGPREGTEIVQLYVRDLAASVTRPVRELKQFRCVALRPGQTRRVSFRLRAAELAFHDERMRRVVEPGQFHLWIGGSAEGGLRGEFEVGTRRG
jgi:beta-glucosidase